jgi:signal transduction histidine kinase
MGGVVDIASAALWEPLSRRARQQLLWCVVAVVYGAAGVSLVGLLVPGTAVSVARGVPVLALLIVAVTITGGSLRVAEWFRRGLRRWVGVQIGRPRPLQSGGDHRVRFAAHLRDPTSWRATLLLILRVPFALVYTYALLWWVGLFNLTYPFWWGMFRNHDPGVRLRPFPVVTPFGWFRVSTLPGTFVVFVAGLAMVLAAPWVTRAVVTADGWLTGTLLEPGGLRTRLRQLEASRSRIVEDAAVTLRRIERDLHDGTQAQLATLAMKLGEAKEKLEGGSAVPYDPAGALRLVNEAHGHAKDALVELRNIVRGIHPPALDVGLDTALATLVARSPVPATLTVDTALRASTAIETIAYFSVAELLANVAKHSHAGRATVTIDASDGRLRLAVGDDGVGGARVGAGTGLTGLADRVHAVDGNLTVSSPEGGPTAIVIDLPLAE